MHKMHNHSKRNTLTTTPTTKHVHEPRRTGPSLTEEQQHRIAVRMATATEKQVKRRHDRSYLFIWGDRKKASVKWFPGGTFEILVPQTLTPEQEHFEFPPRSRLLKKLATATAERKRVMQDDVKYQYDHVIGQRQQENNSTSGMNIMSTTMTRHSPALSVPTMRKPDRDAIAEWFRQKTSMCAERDTTTTNKRKKKTSISATSCVPTAASSTLLSLPIPPQPQPQPPQPGQLRSKAAKRTPRSTASLLAPPTDDSVHKHYVPLSLLQHENTCNRKLPKKEQGLVKLVDVFHQKLYEQQRLAHHHQQQLRNLSSSSRIIALNPHISTTADKRRSCDIGLRNTRTLNMTATPKGFYPNRKLTAPAANKKTRSSDSCKKETSPYPQEQHPIRPARSNPAYTR